MKGETMITVTALAKQINDFEIELNYVCHLIDMVYQSPNQHRYASKYLEDLHTHRQNLQDTYGQIRNELFNRLS